MHRGESLSAQVTNLRDVIPATILSYFVELLQTLVTITVAYRSCSDALQGPGGHSAVASGAQADLCTAHAAHGSLNSTSAGQAKKFMFHTHVPRRIVGKKRADLDSTLASLLLTATRVAVPAELLLAWLCYR